MDCTRRLVLWIVVLLAGALLTCATERGMNGTEDGPQGTYIDEPIILSFSGPIAPVEEIENELIFDLSGDSLVRAGLCNDIFIRYQTSTSCDVNAEVWDNEQQAWRQFALGPSGACMLWVTEQHHMLSGVGVSAGAVLDSASRMKIRGAFAIPMVWALEVNPEYVMIPIIPEAPCRGGLAPGGEFLYSVSSSSRPAVYAEDLSGNASRLFPLSVYDHHTDLAFDGENLWLGNRQYESASVFKFSAEGDTLCQFDFPSLYPDGLTWDGVNLWIAQACCENEHLFCVDTEASCSSGTAVIIDSMPTPGGRSPGLAWDGSHLLVASDRLYRMTREGEIASSYDLPVRAVQGIAWDGTRICVVSLGPAGPTGSPAKECTIACFKLR